MRVNDFDYDLPEGLIAQSPLQQRSQSRLMVLQPQKQAIIDDYFYNLINYLKPGDVLVRNNTKVIPARLYGIKEETGAAVELLLLNNQDDIWECLVGNAKVVKIGTIIAFAGGKLKAECVTVKEEGIRFFKMYFHGVFLEVLDELGTVPLPPYIHEKLEDPQRYQTVYAKEAGSAAAPTAGLHFTPELFEKIKSQGIEVLDLTLHIGLGTFRPLKVTEISEHKMHSEYYELNKETAERLNLAKQQGRRIISVGTTSCRALEANFAKYGKFQEEKATTDIFIYPGFYFQAMDALITNFHLPKSTLIMLVAALAGRDFIMKAYHHAVSQEYRFFSFGDSMFITNE